MIKIAPSVLSADFSRLGDELVKIEQAGAEYVHLDVMDGVFVPNITFGAPIIKCLRPYSKMIFDAHLMITNAKKFIDDFVDAGCDYITFHYESTDDPLETIRLIRDKGAKPGISIKPKTHVGDIFDLLPYLDLVLVMSVEPGFGGQSFMPEALPKIRKLKEVREERGYNFLISVDGGINAETAKLVKQAGVDIIVAGSSIFGKSDYNKAIDELR